MSRSATYFITHNGETHSLHEWSKILGINYKTLMTRKRNGLVGEQILMYDRRAAYKRDKTLFLTHNGQTKSLEDWANELGISVSALQSRIRRHNNDPDFIFARGKKEKPSQLCWDCKNCYNGCPWSLDFEPIEGWKATPTKIASETTIDGVQQKILIDSFYIEECPLFEEDD